MRLKDWQRILTFLFCVIVVWYGWAESEDIKVKSKISEVTVYPNFALITRVCSLKLKEGNYKIIFPDIIPEVDENSLKVSTSGDAMVKLFGAQLKREYLEEEPAEEIRELEKQIQKLEDEVKESKNIKKLLLEEKDFLDSIRLFSHTQFPKELVTKMPTPEYLGKILKFLDEKLRENYSHIMETELLMREKEKKIGVLKRKLNEIKGQVKKLKRTIVVEVQILKQGNLNLSVSYLVRGAWWRPIYEARGLFGKDEVELVSYGVVRQTTGEDWKDVKISLSTARPAIGGRMPYVEPWILKPYKPHILLRKEKKRIIRYQYESFAGNVPEVRYAKPEEKGIAVIYKLPGKATVKSDGTEHKLPISSQTLKAKFEYSTYPRISPFVYLGSRVTNSSKLQLLAGKVNIFFDGDFVGSSSIDNIAPGEKFDLYLGIDQNVKVKRELLEKKVDETLIGGILSRTKRITLKYKISVENYKSKKINVNLFEAMPVSQDERIKVKISNVSKEPTKKDWKDRKGIYLWKLEIEPNQKEEIYYTIIIEHPRNMQIRGL